MPVTRRQLISTIRQSMGVPGRLSSQRKATTLLALEVWRCMAWLERLSNASGQDYVLLESVVSRMAHPRVQDSLALAVYADVIDYSFALGIRTGGGWDYSGADGEAPWWTSFNVVNVLGKMVLFLETRSVAIDVAAYLRRLEGWQSLLEQDFVSCDQMRGLIDHLAEVLKGAAGPVETDEGRVCEVCGWRGMLEVTGSGG